MAVYYRIVLVGHARCKENDPFWRCYESLKMDGHAVAVVDPAIYPEAVREDGSVNTEFLAPFLKRFQPDYIAQPGETAVQILATLQKTAKGQDTKPRHFLIFGYVGPRNFGDELLYRILSEQLYARYPGAYITLIGHEIHQSLRDHGVLSLDPAMKADIDREMNGADAFLLIGGIVFDSRFLEWSSGKISLFQTPYSGIDGHTALTLLAAMNDVPTIFFGIGAGPLGNRDAMALLHLASLTQPRYFVRDTESQELLVRAGVSDSLIEVSADLAFLLEDKTPAPLEVLAGKKYIAVSLREAPLANESFVQRIAHVLDHAYSAHGLMTVFVNLDPSDAAIAAQVKSAMDHGDQAFLLSQDVPSHLLDGIISVLANAQVSLAMRFHASVIANRYGVPSLGLEYDPKIHNYYHRMGRDDLSFPLVFETEELESALDELLGNYRAYCDALREPVHTMEQAAQAALHSLENIIESHESKPTMQYCYAEYDAPDTLRLAETRKQLEAAQAELGTAQAKIDEIYQSTTWKTGRAITWLPRRLKTALRSRK